MGVRGLKTYMRVNADGQRRHRLQNCRLVVDAANFVHHMYSFDYHRGGEYDLYAERLTRLFVKFRRCGIQPLFVFDGAKDWGGGKIRHQLSRMAERSSASARLLRGQGNPTQQVLPIVTYEVFTQCALDFNFPVATVLSGDADEQTASLAGRLGCPLLTVDSDFFLYPLSGGVVPTDSLDLTDSGLDSTVPYMTCMLYSISECHIRTANCRLRPELAPIWASLAGNDYVTDDEAETARGRLGLRRGGNSMTLTTDAISWTNKFDSAEACLKELRERLDDPALMWSFDASLRHYRLKPESECLGVNPEGTRITFPDAAPAPLTDAHRTRKKLVFFIDAMLYGQVMLPVGLEYPDLPGVFESTRPLRAAAYALEASRGCADRTEVIEHVRVNGRVEEQSVSLAAPHRCPGDPKERTPKAKKDGDGAGDSLWRCALAALKATAADEATLAELLPTSKRPLRLALHLLRSQRAAVVEEIAKMPGGIGSKSQELLTCTGVHMARALLVLCLIHNGDLLVGTAADAEDDEPPRKRARASVDFDAYLSPRQDGGARGDLKQSPDVYLALLHHFNAFQAHLISLIMFLQAHTKSGSEADQLLPPMPRLLIGRFAYALSSELFRKQLSWEHCLAGLADRLSSKFALKVGSKTLERLADWVDGTE